MLNNHANLKEIDGVVYNLWFSSIDAMCEFIRAKIQERPAVNRASSEH